MSAGLLSFNAILLAAGLGTRLRPITDSVPKCLVEIGGKSLLEIWLQKLEQAGCANVLVNTHYKASDVEGFLGIRGKGDMSVKAIREEELLGTAGTLMHNRRMLKEGTTMVIHADNVMEEDLHGLVEAHVRRPPGSIMTMLTFVTDEPSSCGIVEVDRQGILRGFHEKVESPPGNLANGAVFLLEPEVASIMEEMILEPVDFSADVVPRLVGRASIYQTREFYMDIGTPAKLKMARNRWKG